MNIIVDTSIIIAVLINEKSKQRIIQLTEGKQLNAPTSLHWELGNALSALLNRGIISIGEIKKVLNFYKEIPLRFYGINLEAALTIAKKHNIYAYDAYFIATSIQLNSPLLSLDSSLCEVAIKEDIKVIEV